MLMCKSVSFYSQKDEDAFFVWIKRIECIEQVTGAGRELYMHLASDNIHEYDLRDLLGFFYRYDIDMQQLARFLNNENKKWFYDNKRSFWHKRVFKK